MKKRRKEIFPLNPRFRRCHSCSKGWGRDFLLWRRRGGAAPREGFQDVFHHPPSLSPALSALSSQPARDARELPQLPTLLSLIPRENSASQPPPASPQRRENPESLGSTPMSPSPRWHGQDLAEPRSQQARLVVSAAHYSLLMRSVLLLHPFPAPDNALSYKTLAEVRGRIHFLTDCARINFAVSAIKDLISSSVFC